MGDEEGDNTGFVIKDRRRFDAEGNTRSAPGGINKESETRTSATVTTGAKSVQKEADSSAPTQSHNRESAEPSEVNFSSFVMSLATQALMQLGHVEPPPGMQIEVDRLAAKQSIDIITMLREKTRGNLDAAESKLIDEIVASLQMSYVKSRSR